MLNRPIVLRYVDKPYGKVTIANDEIRVQMCDAWSNEYKDAILLMCHNLRTLAYPNTLRAKRIRNGNDRLKFKAVSNKDNWLVYAIEFNYVISATVEV